jgi:hypothetical protein
VLPTCAVVLGMVTAVTIHGMLRQAPPAIAATAVALLVTVGGISWIVLTRNEPALRSMVGLTAADLAGRCSPGCCRREPATSSSSSR